MDCCLSLQFDQYQRYKLVSDIINKFRNSEKKFRILEIGAGFEQTLNKFLPTDEIYYIDKDYPAEYSQKDNFIVGDILKIELNEKYDFVVAIDVYEHIYPTEREKFIDILITSSNIATIIAAPFDQENVVNCEFFVNECHKIRHGIDNIWLKEHIANGLPSLSLTIDLIKEHHFNSIIIPNGYLLRWFEMMSLIIITGGRSEFSQMMIKLNEFYNKNYYQYDNHDPAYRQIIIIPKIKNIPYFLDLIAVEIESEEISAKNQLLESFIEKIKKTIPLIERSQEITVKDNQIHEITVHATELSKHAHNLEAIIADRETQIADLQRHAHNLEAIIADRETQIADLQRHTHNLEAIIADRETQIADLQRHTHNLEAIVADRETQITKFRKHSHNLEEIITNQNQQLQEVLKFNQFLVNENQSMKQSLTYNFTTKFHKKIVERLLPENTRRRKYYNLGLSGSRLLINEGWDRFWWCYHERNHPQALSTDQSIPIPQPEITSQELDDIPLIQTKVSVIIPTKNAGPDFQSVLEKLHNQKGIASVEIIIVDSGSTDGTCEVAEKFGCRIFSIKPEDFNHGRTRNYGAEQATGEFIVFLVQDAIPIGDYWLHNMVKILDTNDYLAAASCRQVPRSDADLFACYSMWNHYTAMDFFNDKIVYIEKDRFNQLPFSEKRKLAGLDDVCSCFRKDIFDQLKFENLNFAEDLGIGIRLIENGYKLAFLYSVGVIHSHNRDAEYFLRRYYVDSKSLAEMSEATTTPENRDLNQVINSFNVGYLNMKNSLTRVKTQYPDEISVDHFFSVLKRNLDSYNYINATCPEETKLDKLLSEIFVLSTPGSVDMTQFTREFSGVLDNFQKYVRNQCDSRNTNELMENTQKFFAIYFGSHVGNLYAHHSTDKTMQSIDTILKKGV